MDEAKFKEALLYCCWRSSDAKYWGLKKLCKMLFYADFIAFKELGSSITGATYCKLPQGPVPTESKPIQDRMKRDGELGIEVRQVIDFSESRPIALRKPDISIFGPLEVEILDRVIDWIKPMTGKHISELSHEHPGWKYAAMNDKIEYSTALIDIDSSVKLSPNVLREVARAYEFNENN